MCLQHFIAAATADGDLCRKQGDQIGRIFASSAIVYFGQSFENCPSSAHLGFLFPRLKLCNDFDKKKHWATFWAILSQTHLVTLI
jgi:hypothetical protein